MDVCIPTGSNDACIPTGSHGCVYPTALAVHAHPGPECKCAVGYTHHRLPVATGNTHHKYIIGYLLQALMQVRSGYGIYEGAVCNSRC